MEPNEMLEEIDRVIKNSMRKKREGMPLEDDKDSNVTANNGWIPVGERLPEDGTYLCTLKGELCGIKEPFTGMCGIENGIWDEPDCVIAWRSLPEPYQPDKEQERTENIMGGRLENLKKEERT